MFSDQRSDKTGRLTQICLFKSARITDSSPGGKVLVSSTYQIDLNSLLPVVFVVDARVVDHDVQMAERVHGGLERVCGTETTKRFEPSVEEKLTEQGV